MATITTTRRGGFGSHAAGRLGSNPASPWRHLDFALVARALFPTRSGSATLAAGQQGPRELEYRCPAAGEATGGRPEGRRGPLGVPLWRLLAGQRGVRNRMRKGPGPSGADSASAD